MKRRFLRAVAGIMALLMVVSCAGNVVAAHAKNEKSEETVAETMQEKVLTVTADMVGKNGKLTVTGEWDRIIVPKEIDASHIYFDGVTSSFVEIESGVKSKIELVSGTVGTLSIVPAKTAQMTVWDVCEMISLTGDAEAAIKLYQEIQAENQQYQEMHPTLTTQKDVNVAEVSVSGNVKLDLGKGKVENVKVDADGSQTELSVNISNFSGNVTVKQKDREDGKWMITRIKLKNTKVENLVMEGEEKGNIVLNGRQSEVKEVKVENAPTITLNVPTEKVEIGKDATNVKLNVLTKVDEIQVDADETKIEVGSSGVVESATVEGDNVNISGNGTLTDVEIKGEGAYVSTPDTNVEGENNYVPPVVVTPSPKPELPPSEGEEEGLTITIDSVQVLESVYREFDWPDGTTGILRYDSPCLFGTFSWSRELTEEEIAEAYHSATMYDAYAEKVQLPSTFNLSAGMFAAQFPEYLAAGTYVYQITWYVAGVEVSKTFEFVLEQTIGSNGESEDATTIFIYEITPENEIRILGLKDTSLTEIEIPAEIKGLPVTEIGDRAFDFCTGLVSVKIPDSVTRIGDRAFNLCMAMTTFNFPTELTEIGEEAFYACHGLTEVVLPEKLLSIGDDAFGMSVGLKRVVIPASVNSIGKKVFFESEITEIVVAEESNAYASKDGVLYDKNLTTLIYVPKVMQAESFVIPDTVVTVEEYAIANDSILSLTIPASVQSIEGIMAGLNEIILSEENPYLCLEDGALYNADKTELIEVLSGWDWSRESFSVPTGVKRIASGAFDRTRVTTITLPDGLERIGGMQLMWTDITDITLPDSVTCLEPYAFAYSNLENIVVPESVVIVGEKAFDNSHNITITTVEGSCVDAYAKENGIPVKYTNELIVTITEVGIHDEYYKEYPDPDGTDATCFIQYAKGISGKFSYSRELTQIELNDWWHNGTLYDAAGNYLETGDDFSWWATSSGDFAAQFPVGLKAGDYTYELNLTINGKRYSLKCPFTLTEDITASEE